MVSYADRIICALVLCTVHLTSSPVAVAISLALAPAYLFAQQTADIAYGTKVQPVIDAAWVKVKEVSSVDDRGVLYGAISRFFLLCARLRLP